MSDLETRLQSKRSAGATRQALRREREARGESVFPVPYCDHRLARLMMALGWIEDGEAPSREQMGALIARQLDACCDREGI
jgi:hypothetical protein